MATQYLDLLPSILPSVPDCPDNTIELAIREAAIELCEKSEAYQLELDPITSISGTYEYDLEVPSGTNIYRLLWVTYEGNILEPVSSQLLEQRDPDWRDETGVPLYFIRQPNDLFWVVPVPSSGVTDAIRMRVVLRPNRSSTSLDTEFVNDYYDTIVNGALFRLLRIPSKSWTNMVGAATYGSLFFEGIEMAKNRGKQNDNPVARKVKYGGIGGTSRTSTDYSSRKWYL